MRLALCALGGVVVNVLVAEGCALWSPLQPNTNIGINNIEEERVIAGVRRNPAFDVWVDRLRSLIPAHRFDVEPAADRRTFDGFIERRRGFGVCAEQLCVTSFRHDLSNMDINAAAIVLQGGWPALGMQSRQLPRESGERLTQPWRWHGDGAPMWLWPRRDFSQGMFLLSGPVNRPLLTDILWPGFLLNTATYSAALGVLLFAPAAVRRIHRRRAGRCPACGYSRKGLAAGAVCPECGAAWQAS